MNERVDPKQLCGFPYNPNHDAADGQPWSDGDLWDLRNSLEHGRTIEEVAQFLCRAGSVDEMRRKAEELGLLQQSTA